MTAARTPRYRKWLGWGRLLAGFVSVQVVVQVLGFLGGILLVRCLPKEQYGFFTIGNSMLAMMSMLADNGIGSALSAIGGRVHDDRMRFGSLVKTALRLRRVFAVVSMVVVFPILLWMLLRNGAGRGDVLGVSTGVLLALVFQLGVGVYAVVPRLKFQTGRVQTLDLASTLLRVGLLFAAWAVFLDASVAIYISALALGLQYVLLRRWIPDSIDLSAPPRPEYHAGIAAIVKRQAPNTIYYCIHTQIGVWLIGTFGSAAGVAEVGALGRLAMIFAIMSSVMSGLILPRFARCHSPGLLKRRYWQILFGYASFGAVLVAVAAVFPSELLWILGKNYAGLKAEVLLMVVGAVVGAIDVTMYSLNISRGWIVSAWLGIPTGLLSQIIGIVVFDVSTVRGVLLMGIVSAIPHIVINYWTARKGMKALATAEADARELPHAPKDIS